MKYPRDFEKYKYLINPKYLENFSTVEGKPITNIFNIDPENNLIEVEYDGKREWVSAAPDFLAPKDSSKLSDEYDKLQGITDPETGNLLFPGDKGYDELHMRQIRGIGNPLFGGILRDNQYRTELTNEEANNIADAWVEQTTPGIGTILNAGLLKPMNTLSLTQLIGGLRGYNVYSEENPGIVSELFSREHPYWTMAANLGGDILGGYGVGKVLNLGVNGLNNAYQGILNYNRARQISREIANAPLIELETIFPGLIEWTPKLTVKGYHASNEVEFIPNFYFEGWAQKTHNAPLGIYFAKGNGPESGFLSRRPYVHNFSIEFEKPQIQIGEVRGTSKNGTRNLIEENAINLGADGIIYEGIADNQMSNLTIYKVLHPDVKLTRLNRILDAKGIGEANPQTVVRTGHTSLSDPNNPFQIRLTRLNNKFIGDYDPSTQKLLNRPIVRVNEIRKAFKELDPSLSDDELDLAVQTAFANRRGVHIPIGDNSGKTIGGVSVVDIKEALKYLRESGIINPNADDVGTVVAHEAGHAVKVSKFAKNLVKDFKNPDEFYTLVGQILDHGKVTKNEGISFNRLMKLTDKYLRDKKLDNGITELRKYLSNYPMSLRKNLMKAIGRFSVGLFGTYLVGRKLKQSNNNGKVL